MGVKIHLEPKATWAFFQKNHERMEDEMVVIAENDDTEYAIYITDNDNDERHNPLLLVYKGDLKIFEEGVIDEDGCTETAKQLYLKYLFPVSVTYGKMDEMDEGVWDDTPYSTQDMEDAIYEREDELTFAMYDLLEIVLGRTIDEIAGIHGKDFVQQVVDDFCEYLANDHCVSIYRPTILPTDDGDEEFVEYPYDCDVDGDDEDED